MQFESAQANLSDQIITKHKSDLQHFINHIEHVSKARNYSFNESSINLPFDIQLINNAIKYGEDNKHIKTVIVIGIGGSNLGTQAVYEGLNYYLQQAKFIFIDDIDSNQLESIFNSGIDTHSTLVVAISKSGNTTSTIVNLEILLKKYEELKDNLVVITGHATKLNNQAKDLKIKVFEIPEKVGGRFSVFSNVGLIPLSLCCDIQKLTTGAKQAVVDFLIERDIEKNNACLSALSIYNAILNKKNVLDFFAFDKRLERTGKWYRQLVAESLGKNNKGILPTVSVGLIDLHSVVQYYIGGPKHIFTNFVNVAESSNNFDLKVGEETVFEHLVDNIKLKSAFEVKKAIYSGVKESYIKNNLDFTEITIDEVSEFELGYIMQFKMIEVMILGHLLNINTFNQPNVEEYKNEARKILKNEK